MKPMPACVSSLHAALALGCGLGACATPALAAGPAGVKLDGTLGGNAATLTGPTYNITQSLGQLAGGNLFFSFQYFNILTNQTALFTTSGVGINNVISRVTGGYASTIDGQIKLVAASGAPDFYFINPSGVTFTANASINVPAAFAVTTANYLKFSDGNFYADPTKTSTLSSMAPEAFGFLGTTRAPVNVEGAKLSAAGGSGEFQVVAGDVTIDGGGQLAVIDTANADVRVIATGSQAVEVPLTGTFSSTDGTVTLQAGGQIYSVAAPGSVSGGIYVSAGTLLLDGTNSGTSPTAIFSGAEAGAGAIRLDVGGSATLNNGGTIVSETITSGGGAPIAINAGALTIQGQDSFGASQVLSKTFGAGTGGAITLNVTGLASVVNSGSVVNETSGPGNAGDVALTAGSMNIDAAGNSTVITGISSTSGSSGNAGHVTVTTTGAATISNGGLIQSNTSASGDAGGVTLNAGSLNIDGGASAVFTRIDSSAEPNSTGNAGQVIVTTTGATALSNHGEIQSDTFGSGAAGRVTLNSGSLSIDGGGSGISSSAEPNSTGNAGEVAVTTGATSLTNGGQILSATFSSGNAGYVSLAANSLSIDGGTPTAPSEISSAAQMDSTGNAGQVTVTTSGATTLSDGGLILSNSLGLGNANRVSVTTGSLMIDTGGAIASSAAGPSASAGSAGTVSVSITGTATLDSGGAIASDTDTLGNAGLVSITAGALSIEGNATIQTSALQGSSGNAGNVTVTTAGATTISSGAAVLSETYSSGKAGDVSLTAGSLNIDGGAAEIATGISSSARPGSSGNAGHVTVTTAGAATLTSGGQILSVSRGLGNAGDVTLTAGSVDIDGGASSATATGVSSSAEQGSMGNAGHVTVNTTGATTVSSGGQITSVTNGHGNAGVVTITAGSLSVDGAGNPAVTGISSSAQGSSSSGNAGEVTVTTTGATTLTNGAQMGSVTSGSGSAGDVTVSAGSLTIDGGASNIDTLISSSALSGSRGNAGKVAITASGAIAISNGGVVLSETDSMGNAGDVTLKADTLNIDGGTATELTGISSRANYGSRGNAGQVTVTTAGATTISNDGEILSTTRALGNAGDVTLTAGSLSIEGSKSGVITGISTQAASGSRGKAGIVTVDVSGTADLDGGTINSAAQSGSGGQPGTVEIRAGTLVLGPNSEVAIENKATVADPKLIAPTQLSIQAGTIQMDGGLITAASGGNIAASAIDITYQQTLHMDPSIISTASNQGNGGPITITGLGPLWLQNSSITTSVYGKTNGNGGDIRITVPYIVLDSGFIQANTTAPKASGGDVVITDDALVTSFGSYFAGGSSIENLNSANLAELGENVVQAAAPDGLSGTLTGTKPTLDFGSALLGLTGTPSAPIAVSRSLCTYRLGSSLAVAGRGGLPVSYRDPLWIDFGEENAGAAKGTAPTAQRSVSDAPFHGLSFIACR